MTPRSLLALCALPLLALPARPVFAVDSPQRRAVVVSIDGLSPSAYLDPDARGLAVPNLRRLAAEGAFARAVVGVLPTNTYPSHTTLVTGVPPRVHGILANRIFDPLETSNEAWFWYAHEIRVPTLWSAARAAGLTTAAISWPVTVGAPIDWLVPEVWRSGSSNEHDRNLLRALSTPGLIAEFETAAGRPLRWFPDDVERTELALHVLRTRKPNLLLLHLGDHDFAQHHDGPGAPSINATLERADAQLGRLRAALDELGLSKETLFAVVSDHGFLPMATALRPNVLLRDAGLVTLDDAGRVKSWRALFWSHGGSASLRLADPNDREALATARAIVATKAAEPDSGIAAILEPEEIEALGSDPALTPLAIDAKSGFCFDGGVSREWIGSCKDKAGHGFDPRRPEMAAALVMAGAGAARKGDLGNRAMTEIAPTIARWLGLDLALRAETIAGSPGAAHP